MKIDWKISKRDAQSIRTFVSSMSNNAFVQKRKRRCIENTPKTITKNAFWHEMVSCLLTTQQRSGPNSPVNKLIGKHPFPLRLSICRQKSNLPRYVEKTISSFGGIRRGTTIGYEMQHNLHVIEGKHWKAIRRAMQSLNRNSKPDEERRVAELIREHLKGIGPKQARNLLQGLGLVRYETPIDSRITKWLNHFGFPVTLSASALGDPNYYNFVMDGIQILCQRAGVYPCMLDAAIFASYDGDAWSKDDKRHRQ